LAHSTMIRKWKWLFVNRCACKNPIYTWRIFLKSCQDGTNTSVWWGIMHKNKDTSLE